jgi:hypothetical protein
MTFDRSLRDSVMVLGYAYIPGYLSKPELAAAISATDEVGLERAQEVVGKVRQCLSSTRFAFQAAPDAIQAIGHRLRNEVVDPLLAEVPNSHHYAWPSEVTVAEYVLGEGITKHRDHLSYRSVIALCSLAGVGAMEIFVEDSTVELKVTAGDLVLLGAPAISERPAHSVNTVSQYRLSLGFRLSEGQLLTNSPTHNTTS